MSSNNKKAQQEGLASKVAIVAGLSVVLIVGVVVIGLFLFTGLILDTPYVGSGGIYNGEFVYEGFPTEPSNSVDKMVVEYKGGTLYAGGQVRPEDFVVKVIYGDGTEQVVTGYKSDIQDKNFRLQKGSNSIVFYYGKLSAIITVVAVDVNTLQYPPSYVTTTVDEKKAYDIISALDSGKLSYDEAFSKVAFTGDSQIKALSSFGILPGDRIVAKVGESFNYFNENFDNIVAMCQDKDVLVVHYGINTLSIHEETRKEQVQFYKSILIRLQAALPDVRIIVSGVFPVATNIYFNQQRFAYIIDFDRELFKMCMELGIDYLSDNQYMETNQQVFSADGLHLTKSFYTDYWLKNLITTMGIY